MNHLPLDDYLLRDRARLLERLLRLEQECERLRQELEQGRELRILRLRRPALARRMGGE